MRWNGSRIGLQPRPASRARPVPNIPAPTFAIWRRGKFFLLGRVDFGEGGLHCCLLCPLFSQYPVSPDANAVRIRRPFLTKRKRRDRCCIRREGSVMWIVEKNRKRARMRCASGLFSFCGEEGGFGQWRFGTAVAPPLHQSKVFGEGGRGRTFLQKGPPPVFTHSLNTGPARSWSRPPCGSRQCCRRGHSCRARRIPRRFHERP